MICTESVKIEFCNIIINIIVYIQNTISIKSEFACFVSYEIII